MYVLAQQPRSIGQVLDAAAQLFKAAFAALLPFSITAGVLAVLPGAILLLGGPSLETDPGKMLSLMRSPAYWTVMVVSMFVNIIVYGAAMVRAESVAQGASVSAGEALDVGARRCLIAFVSSICFGLVVAVGLVLLIVPGLILMVSLVFGVTAIMIDGKGIIEGLSYSHKLVWGNWWRTATLLTVGIIIVYILFVIAALALGMTAGFVSRDRTILLLVQFLSSGVATFIMTPFLIALMLEIYRDLKLRKEGGDLAGRLSSLQPASR